MLLRLLPLLLVLVSTLGCRSAEYWGGIQQQVDRVDVNRLHGWVTELTQDGPRYEGDRVAIGKCVRYLETQLRSFGYEPSREYFYSPLLPRPRGEVNVSSAHANVLVEIRGSVCPQEVVEIGAHYDTVPLAPGADDNTSGVAGLLELARLCAGHRFERTLRFCFFAYEEGGLWGSRHHAQWVADSDQEHQGILVLEMIGYTSQQPNSQRTPVRIPWVVWPPRVGDFITVVGNFSSGAIGNDFENAASRHVSNLKYYSLNRIGGFFGDASRSDHSPYWQLGLRGVMITDTADFRNPHYHQTTDTIDQLDFEFMADVTRATVGMVFEWAGWISPLNPQS